ncbi:MAG TPA: DUF1343 domain-containing protein [Polyangiaceae bacterium]|jgi:uncharacterized protein YbbC (DUF1343 family)|nr:MAG: hypothetical protein BWY17_01756 [Deltaproteobacteria bacterium ADurb.Bin207]HNZ23965.1 DUF1343 domain-containing protein [Polyangiaceae bacterium]HOD21784.1 DUF1343 domain-containing protein [Polyangiaceae bacterium]HOE49494.1 DUF1343 domain-containing protein [Polyangiaceae bacterium]HOH02248.1 DUF1343 domain-containing protein [Polyangiaceae bacterium]
MIMQIGLDRLVSMTGLIRSLRAGRVGLLAHPASVDGNLEHVSRVLRRLGIVPRRIFGPEHGYGGEAQDMVGVEHATDTISGAPIVSLYGQSYEDLVPRREQVEDLDWIIADLSDVGSRYYTFVWTMVLMVRAAHAAGVGVVLLDRPNPIGGERLEGKVQQPGYLSFVGLEPIPVRHGLTAGELVAEMASRDGIGIGPGEPLDVVALVGWEGRKGAECWERPFVMPSPNMPTADTAVVYPGGCLLEGTNLSEGRGTTRPFEICGAPWLDGVRMAGALHALPLEGFVARPLTFQPTFHKYAGQICGGVQIHVTDRDRFRPMATYVALVALAAYHAGGFFRFRTERYEFVEGIPAIDLLSGSASLREGIEAGKEPMALIDEVCSVDESDELVHQRAMERVMQAEAKRK